MHRRAFLLAPSLAAQRPGKTHIVTLSFDDGFKDSFQKTAAIYEHHGLRACLNVIALGHFPGFAPILRGVPDPMTPFPKGDFELWNRLRERGHEVMPHTYDHQNLAPLPFPQASGLIDKCIEYFHEHLDNFHPALSVYSFAYNSSTPEIEGYALSKFLAIRTRGKSPVNPIPSARTPTLIGCNSYGPANCDDFLESQLTKFLNGPGGWYVFNSHGLDGEGWGPLSSRYLDSLLSRLSKLPHVEILPAGEVLLRLPARLG